MSRSRLRTLMAGLMTWLGVAAQGPVEAQFLSRVGRAIVQVPDPLELPRDVVDERIAEHWLRHRQAQLQADLARGDAARVQRDLRRINADQHLVEFRQWEIRRDSLQAPGPPPFHRSFPPTVAGAVATPQPAGPTPPAGPVASAPAAQVPIRIIATGPAGAGVAYAIDGVPARAATGQPRDLQVAATSVVTFDGGGSVGPRRYSLTAGTYEFRPTDAGWAFYKLPPSGAGESR